MDSYTVAELLRKPRTAQGVNPGRVAITFEGRHVTYDELDERSDRLASALHAQGFTKGDRVGVLLYNRIEWAEVFFAVAKLGGVVVPVNYLLKAQEVSYILDDCQATWVVFEQALRPVIDGVRAGGDTRRYVGLDLETAKFLATVERERITSVLLVPTVLKRVLAEPTFGDHDLGSLRLICSGGEPVPVTAIDEARRKLPACSVLQVYGMSEFPTMMLYLNARYATEKAGSAGRACSAAEVRVVDEQGVDVPPGTVGEIICRSPATMLGYYGKPEASADTLVDGWLHTGDLAQVDDEGFVYVSGRSKDVIITGGLNVYPAEVERVLAQHPAVLEAAVVGRPDPKWGEIGDALVLHTGQALGDEELLPYLKEQLANYKIPKRFTFTHDPLPRTTSGKVQKFKVKAQANP